MSDTRNRLEYTRPERQRKAIAERIIDNPDSKPAQLLEALKVLERLATRAERRTRDRAEQPAEPQPTVLTVDDLVTQLEAQKTPSQPIEPEGLKNVPNAFVPIEPVLGPPTDGKALEVTPTPETTAMAFCGFCSAAGKWNTVSGGVILCPTCFAKMCAADMRQTAAAARARAEQPADWAGDFVAARNVVSSDFEKSCAIWAEQDRENADRQDQERIERARLEGQYNAARARWIQDGGRL